MIRYEFGDGKSAFTFFKDKGGKENHMVARVKIEGKFKIALVYEDGSAITNKARVHKGRKLLELFANNVPATTDTTYEFAEEFEVKFRLMHVSRIHNYQSFKLQFVQDDKVLLETIPIEVRSKLKTNKLPPENSNGAPGCRKRRASTITVFPNKRAKPNNFVLRREFNSLIKKYTELVANFNVLAHTVNNLREEVHVAAALHDTGKLLDPELLKHLL